MIMLIVGRCDSWCSWNGRRRLRWPPDL